MQRRSLAAAASSVTNLAWANIASTAPAAHRASLAWQETLASSGGAYFANEAEQSALLPLRREVALLLNADTAEVCVGSSASEIMSNYAWALRPPAGSNIVSSAASFPSTVYPWHRVAAETGAEVRLAPYNAAYYTEPSRILELIDEQTSVVTLSHVEYISGQRYDLELFANAAHAAGATFVVDATQSLGVVPIDVHSSGADLLVASGYKWLRGTFGVAVGWLSPSVLQSLTPSLVGFRSHADMWELDASRLVLPDDASRWEHGSLHFGAALGLAAAVEELNAHGAPAVWSHARGLSDAILQAAPSLGLEVISPIADAERSGIVSLKLPDGVDAAATAKALLDEHRLLVSSRAGMLRVSPHIDNSNEDVERLLAGLESLFP